MSVKIDTPREAIEFYNSMTDDELVEEWDEQPYHEDMYVYSSVRLYALITVINKRELQETIIAKCRKHKAYREYASAAYDYFYPCAPFMKNIVRYIRFDDVWDSPFNDSIHNEKAYEHGSRLLNFIATGDPRQLLAFYNRIKSMTDDRWQINTAIKVVSFWRTEICSCRDVPFFVKDKESTFQKVFIDDWNQKFPKHALLENPDYVTNTWTKRPMKLWTSSRVPFFVLDHLFARVRIQLTAIEIDKLVEIWDKGTLPKITFYGNLVEVPAKYMFICMSFALLNPDKEGGEHICKRLNALQYPKMISYIHDMDFDELPKVKFYQQCVPLWRGLMSENCMSKELREKYLAYFTTSFDLCMISLQINFREYALFMAAVFMLKEDFKVESLYEWKDEIEKHGTKTINGVLVLYKYGDTYYIRRDTSLKNRSDYRVWVENPTFGEIVGLVDPKFWSRGMITDFSMDEHYERPKYARNLGAVPVQERGANMETIDLSTVDLRGGFLRRTMRNVRARR